jgi:hypothetical protein
MRRPRSVRWLLAAGLAGLASCAPPRLLPDAAAPSVHTARLEQGAIEVLAEVGSTPTNELPKTLTPMKITIRNTTDRGIHVSLDEIILSETGRAQQVVSIDDIHLWRMEPTVGLLPGALPGLPGLLSSRHMKNLRMGSPEYFTLVRGKHPHKKRVEETALKGGYIEAGQTVSGYVYFEPVSGDDGRVRLEVRIRSGAQSGTLTNSHIPFTVEK